MLPVVLSQLAAKLSHRPAEYQWLMALLPGPGPPQSKLLNSFVIEAEEPPI